MIPTTVLILSVCLLMQAACDVAAFAHGWQDGPDNRQDRHQWIPRAFYALGWRLRRAVEDAARAELAERHPPRPQLAEVLDMNVTLRVLHPDWNDTEVADEVRRIRKDHR